MGRCPFTLNMVTGSEALLAQVVQQIKSLELSTMIIVTFKASKECIALIDNVNGWVRGIVSNHYFKLWMGVVTRREMSTMNLTLSPSRLPKRV